MPRPVTVDPRPRRCLGRTLAAALLVALVGVAGCGGTGRKRAAPVATGAAGPPAPHRSAHARRRGARLRRRPNVVFVLTDDLAWNLVRYMPHVRRMRHDGLTFTNYFVTDSLCCPSRSSIFTGRLPHDTGVLTNNWPSGGFGVFHARGEERHTFSIALQRAGYRTALMGKYLNGYDPGAREGGARPYVPPGWNEWDVAGNGYQEYGYALNQDGHLVAHGYQPRDYLTDVVARRGVRFIDAAAARRQPFLLELATFAPHSPFVPSPRDIGRFPRVRAPRDPSFDVMNTAAPAWLSHYAALTRAQIALIDSDFRLRVEAVQAIDRMIGQIEDELRRRGLARDTYLVFSSDNGLHMGEHRLLPGKLTAFDTDIRVPLIVVGPRVPRGREVPALVQNTDLAPTFLGLAGQPVPPRVEGRSLIPFLRGRHVRGWRHAVLIEHRGPDLTPSDPDLPTQGAGNPDSYEAIRTPTRLYVEYVDGEREVYALRSDPWELDNLQAGVAAPLASVLHRTLADVASCHSGAACWRAEGGG